MKTRGLSIKYKLLILLTVVPIVALSVYTMVAIDLFRKDKIAYVFDSSSTVVSSLVTQVKAEINQLSTTIQPFVRYYNPQSRQFVIVEGKKQALEDTLMDYLAIYHPKNNSFELGDRLSKSNFNVSGSWLEGSRVQDLLRSADTHGVYLSSLANKSLLFILRRGQSGDTERSLILTLVKKNQLSDYFSSADSFVSYLASEEGEIYLGGEEDQKGFQKWLFLKKMKEETLPSRTIETKSPEGKDYLVSYSKLGMGGLVVISMVEKSKALIAVKLLLAKSGLFFVAILSASLLISLFASQRLTSALTRLLYATRKVAQGDYNVDLRVKSRDEVGLLSDSFNTMATELSRLMSENIEKARMEKELETARAVQDALFPGSSGQIEEIKIEGFYASASECGGDWWHYSRQGDKAFFWIGDATGHGAPAALITSAAKSVASIVEDMSDMTPAHAMKLLNSSIYKTSKGKICMTFFIGALDFKSGEFTFCNASHEPPILIPYKGGEAVKKMDLEPIMSESFSRLGEAYESTYKDDKITLEKGDRIFFYTDGVTELMGPDGDMYEERRLLRSIVAGSKKTENLKELREYIHQDLEEFRQMTVYEDDVTYFLIES